MKKKKEDITRGLDIGSKADSAAHVGNNKVLPINDVALSSSGSGNDRIGAKGKWEKLRGDKIRTILRMKELLRLAAAAKAEKGGKYISRKVLQFRNRGATKTVQDEDEFSNDSPKISFRWEVGNCSVSSSVYSAISMVSSSREATNNMLSLNSTPIRARTGNWITTDSEFNQQRASTVPQAHSGSGETPGTSRIKSTQNVTMVCLDTYFRHVR
ncbi:hypothetical protein LguiA_020615 [Lonicera macranthoides]